MAKNRILYGLFLLAAVIFHSFYTGWFSFFLLVFAVLLPVFSLLVSLPAMLRAAYEAELPARCFCGQTVQYRLTARHMAKLPVSRCRLRLTVSDAVGGEVRQQRLELAGTLGFALRIFQGGCGVLELDGLIVSAHKRLYHANGDQILLCSCVHAVIFF